MLDTTANELLNLRLLDDTEGFEFEPRTAANLPENWISVNDDGEVNENEISWFLNSYKHKGVADDQDCLAHIQAALKDLQLL